MITVMDSGRKPMNEKGNFLDSQLWHACAGAMVKMPLINAKVLYFPQGHAEHSCKNVDFGSFSRIPPLILCRVSSINYLADNETDEVYAKIRLMPCNGSEFDVVDDEDGFLGLNKTESQEKSNSFSKTLTQSDANNGGGFSVPRYCAETIFPPLDYSAEPPVQNILAKDVHGEIWRFRHIYRGTPRRHLLTTGWSNFVNQKKLVAGDSVVFLRAENGDLCIGIRRAKRGINCGSPEPTSGWNTGVYRGISAISSVDETRFVRKTKTKISVESVIEAANLAANGQAFEVVYYPLASTPEFVVKASNVKSAMRIQWCPGMRFKMPFETEDSSRISWFMGTINSVHVDDPIHWPNSPWRLLQVTWDEPDLLHNVKRVNPWLVEVLSNMHLSPFSQPRKRMRIPQASEFPFFGQFSTNSFVSNNNNNPLSPISPLCCLSNNNDVPVGIQGARHPQFEPPCYSGVQTGLLPFGLKQGDYGIATPHPHPKKHINNFNESKEKKTTTTTPAFVLFGQPIFLNSSMDNTVSKKEKTTTRLSSDSGSVVLESDPKSVDEDQELEFGLKTGHCKVFMESEDVGRTLDLSVFGSYEELYQKLAEMFGLERSEILSNVIYQCVRGGVKHTGDKPFSVFLKAAKRITILSDSGSDNVGR